MSAKTISMHKIKQVLQLYHISTSIRGIERLSGVSRNTIRSYISRFTTSGISITELLSYTDEQLDGIFIKEGVVIQEASKPRHSTFLQSQLTYLKGELSKTGVTKLLLWEEYKKQHPEGFGYTHFCNILNRSIEQSNAVMHFTHVPAQLLEIDFAGDKLSYINTQTGEVIACEILVCVLPYSGYVYCCALPSQRQECFIRGIAQCLSYLGGVPYCIKSDNLKSAVTKANRYEPTLTEAMELLSAHYNTTIMATRVRKPRDKATVENAVRNVYRRIYAPLRDTTFTSLASLNAGIAQQNKVYNDRILQGKQVSRKSLFDIYEQPLLRALPSESYTMQKVTHSKVAQNYHVIIGEDYHYYSVPYTLIGKSLKIIYTDVHVEIYHEQKRVAIHNRNYSKRGYSTLEGHMPSNHQATKTMQGWDAAYFIDIAAKVGSSTKEVIETILRSKAFREQTYNTCIGIIRLGKQYGNHRLEAACGRLLPSGKYNYRILSSILSRNLDQAPTESSTYTIPAHDNIRGTYCYN